MEGEDGKQLIHRMKRLTIGVTSSPFLATKVLLQMATDQQEDHPAAAGIIREDFYSFWCRHREGSQVPQCRSFCSPQYRWNADSQVDI